MPKPNLTLLAPLALLASSPPAWASDFVDTRVSFTFGDDDVLHESDTLQTVSPRPGFGERPGYQLFFENLNTRTTGRENELHLVVYKKAPGFFPKLTTEAAVALRLDLVALTSTAATGSKLMRDDGTYIRIAREIGAGNGEVVLFPLSTTRFRLGYLYALTWGDDEIFPKRLGPGPGLKLGFTQPWLRTFLGLKTATMQTVEPPVQQQTGENLAISHPETFYGALGGVGTTVGKLDPDVGGGWFQMGDNELSGVRGEPMTAVGGSGRVAWVDGIPVRLSADLKLSAAIRVSRTLNRRALSGGFDGRVARG